MEIRLKRTLIEWLKRRSPSGRVKELVRAISAISLQIQDKEDTLSTLVRTQILLAEEDCNKAASDCKLSTKESNEECLRRVRFAMFRLDLARQQLQNESCESKQPDFVEGTAEHSALLLSGAIIKTKMAIEFSNCLVNDDNKLQLINITKMLDESPKLVKAKDSSKAKRAAEAALLRLYLLIREIEIENQESIVDLNDIWKHDSKEMLLLRTGLSELYSLKAACREYSGQVPKKFFEQIEDSNKKLLQAIAAHAKEHDEMAAELVTSSLVQIETAAAELNRASPKRDVIALEVAETSTAARVKQFNSQALQLQNLVTNRATQADLALRRLDASQNYYLAAEKTYLQALAASEKDKPKLIEKAETLARSARIDLVFTRNLLINEEGLVSQERIDRKQTQ